MSTSEREVAGLITEIDEGRLELRPFFQRRLVWTSRDKEYFIETVLRKLPFPEIFVSTSEVDTGTARVKKWLVDGQQRVTVLRDYFQGKADLLFKLVKPFADLEPEEQQQFLHYKVAVRDLGMVTVPAIKDIFNRINSTDYSLKKIEILNALYSGVYKRYCIELSENEFFTKNKVFRKGGDKRMGDVTFCVILVTTLQAGYFRRDERNEEYLNRYNDDFQDKERIQAELDRVFDFIDQCTIPATSRVWKQTDMFTLLVEIHSAMFTRSLRLDPVSTGKMLTVFYDQIDAMFKSSKAKHNSSLPVRKEDMSTYLKAATKATNDKYARVDRATVVATVLDSIAGQGSKPTVKPEISADRKPKA